MVVVVFPNLVRAADPEPVRIALGVLTGPPEPWKSASSNEWWEGYAQEGRRENRLKGYHDRFAVDCRYKEGAFLK